MRGRAFLSAISVDPTCTSGQCGLDDGNAAPHVLLGKFAGGTADLPGPALPPPRRLSPPAHLVGRCAAEDTHLAGYHLQKGGCSTRSQLA